MKKIINYYYNFFPETISKQYGGFSFEDKDKKYLLTELIILPEQFLDIYENLMLLNIKYFIILYNKDNLTVTLYENKYYVLFIINCNQKQVLRFDEQFFIQLDSEINWSKLWSERIDYYEIQINELAQEKKIILHNVYYYIGLTENAIIIADKYEKQITKESGVQHHRMNAPITKGDYFNPANMIVDVSIRDIAEYIKSSFFIEKKDSIYYIDYIKSLYLTEITANLLIARLLYPSYYFDIFDEIILENRDEEDLISIINLQKNYERLLKEMYILLSQDFKMLNINWLKIKL
ncbi:MAG: hypothetical protein PHF21_01325 [Bacilli bacterium]|nr:hypothetical protein [Bacilli bacterium]